MLRPLTYQRAGFLNRHSFWFGRFPVRYAIPLIRLVSVGLWLLVILGIRAVMP